MAEIELIGVPFDGYGREGNQALAASALRDAGLVEAFSSHDVVVSTDLDLPTADRGRGADTSLINEQALIGLTDLLNQRIGEALRAGRFPVVYGGDCSTLFGIVTGLGDVLGEVGLVFVDGHEDTMPLDVSEDGEAANAEIGLLLGLTGRLLAGPLRDRLPALQPQGLAVLGPRDEAWRRQFNVGSLRDVGVWLRSEREVAADPAGAGRQAVEHVTSFASRWWLHVDLDVLDPGVFAAQGLPDVADEPGGLTWRELRELLVAAVALGACLGWSIAIYDPDQDPNRDDARRIVHLVGEVAAAVW